MSNAAARLAGVLADQYHIERELGAGGMATVYVAEDLKHHRRVAIKVLRPNLAQALGAVRFLREESSRDGAGRTPTSTGTAQYRGMVRYRAGSCSAGVSVTDSHHELRVESVPAPSLR